MCIYFSWQDQFFGKIIPKNQLERNAQQMIFRYIIEKSWAENPSRSVFLETDTDEKVYVLF